MRYRCPLLFTLASIAACAPRGSIPHGASAKPVDSVDRSLAPDSATLSFDNTRGADSVERTVRSFVAAYNAHDVRALLELADSGITWLSIAGDSVGVETRGHAELEASLAAYFRRIPTARSTIEALTVTGPWVTVRERAHWEGANGPRSQAAVSVYEVRAGRVRRVWYFPVER